MDEVCGGQMRLTMAAMDGGVYGYVNKDGRLSEPLMQLVQSSQAAARYRGRQRWRNWQLWSLGLSVDRTLAVFPVRASLGGDLRVWSLLSVSEQRAWRWQ